MPNKLNQKILNAISEVVKDQEEYQVGYEVKHLSEKVAPFSKEHIKKVFITIELTKLV